MFSQKICMRIKSIKIKDIFGKNGKELSAVFNDDVTILCGKNGCGKTTLLNILTHIVSGKFYHLFKYRFTEIEMNYFLGNNENSIIVTRVSDVENNDKIVVEFEDRKFPIYNKVINRINRERYRYENDFERTSLKESSLFLRIKRMFNYIYLPLDRNCIEYKSNVNMNLYSNDNDSDLFREYLYTSIERIQYIIKNYIMNINIQISEIDEDFRREILRMMSTLSYEAPLNASFAENKEITDNDIENTKNSYIKALKENNIIDDKKISDIETFLKLFKEDKNKNDISSPDNSSMAIDYAWKLFQYLKMKEVAKSSETHDSKKNEIYSQKEKFISIINGFFNTKKVDINDKGELTIYEDLTSIPLIYLSSGEKQILISLVTLYFGLDSDTTGTFIVDEPETSLHIEWQRKLISSMLATRNDIQLICATHSPEIISDYGSKTFIIK